MKAVLLPHLESMRSERRVPGASVMLTRNGVTLFHEGLGFADREEQRRVTPDTVFGVASVTKSFTCLAIMQLADAGKLDVHAPVADYLPAFTRSGSTDLTGITVHHLMSNSSGLPPMGFRRNALARSIKADPSRELLGLDLTRHQPPIDTVDELISAISAAGITLLRPPGRIFSYSNEGFALLGRIIEVVSGSDYVTYVTRNILEPLNMSRSVFTLEDLEALPDVANLYSYIKGFEQVEPTPGYYWAPAMLSAGYLRSTTADLNRYAQAFLELSPVELASPTALQQMQQPAVQVSARSWYGYGFMIHPDHHGQRVVEHGGSTKGVGANLAFVPAAGVAGVTLTNITGCPVNAMNRAGINLALGLPLDAAYESFSTLDLPDAELERFTGTFESAELVTLEVRSNDTGGLEVQDGTLRQPAVPVAPDAIQFDSNGRDTLAQFFSEQRGKFQEVRYGLRILRRSVDEN